MSNVANGVLIGLFFYLVYVTYQDNKRIIRLLDEQRNLFIYGDTDYSIPHSTKSIDELLVEYEEIRDRDFNERIAKIERELYNGGTTADELHPGVKNIPHQEINTSPSGEEYAE